MHPLQKQFQDYVSQHQLFGVKEKVLIAVSGGVDSIVLGQLMLKSEYSFAIAHCNFGLRGKESDEDEAFVKEWAQKNQIKFHAKKIDLDSASIQLAARNARYKWFKELAEEFGYQKIATGHHLNDSMETLFINLVRGTGLKGLTGIAIHNDKIVRPLLFSSKDEILDYAKEERLNWREDSSNGSLVYDRNVIRHNVMVDLLDLNPSLLETFKNTLERIQYSNSIFQQHISRIKQTYLQEGEANRSELKLNWITSNDDVIVLSEILSEYGFNYVTSKEIFESIGQPGKQFLSAGYEITMDRESLFLTKKNSSVLEATLIENVGSFKIGNRQIDVSFEMNPEIINDQKVALLDASVLPMPFTIRKWEHGDKFKPLGLNGAKKVSDFLVDQKVPVAMKDEVLVLESSENKIAWLVGYRIAEDFKVGPNTNEVLKIVVQ